MSIFGDVVGTPEYMAPEQFDGETSELSDIYSFGVMLYEMVSGERPFRHAPLPGARIEIFRKAHKEETPAELKGYPKPLTELIYACLEKKPENRPKSFNEIEEGLTELYEYIIRGTLSET